MIIENDFLQRIGPSSIRNITGKINEKVSSGIKVTSFAGGMPAKEYFPMEDMKRITMEIFDEEDGQCIQYAPSTGYEPLKMALVDYMKRVDI